MYVLYILQSQHAFTLQYTLKIYVSCDYPSFSCGKYTTLSSINKKLTWVFLSYFRFLFVVFGLTFLLLGFLFLSVYALWCVGDFVVGYADL